MDFDVVVVGAGPVGSYCAKALAEQGHRVVVLEEHSEVGLPVHCTGVIGARSFDAYDFPKETIKNSIYGMRFIAPSLDDVTLRNADAWAHIVCRSSFDKALSKSSVEAGAVLELGVNVEDVECFEHHVEVTTNTSLLKARFCVLATGSMCSLPYRLGFYRPWYFMKAAQVECEVEGLAQDTVDAYLGHSIAGGEFVWMAPVSEGRARLGVFSKYHAYRYLEDFLQRSDIAARLPKNYKIGRGVIPIGGLDDKHVPFHRVFTVGDAAGQVKPTSAGGIVYGVTAACILADKLSSQLKNNSASLRMAQQYYRDVRRRLGFELVIGDFFRSLFSQLKDEEWDRVIHVANDPKLLKTIEEKSIFDQHSQVIRWALMNKDYRAIFMNKSFKPLLGLMRQSLGVWMG